MNTSLNWIKAMVPGLECTDQEFRDAMTLSGTKVEGFERYNKNLEKIVVGQIESVEAHPDASKLVVCKVNVGTEVLQIVTGAPNVKVGSSGQKVIVVLDGGKVAGGHDGGALPENGIKIKKGKLRGVESFGMMCSMEELGVSSEFFPGADPDGIYFLGDDAEVGSSAIEYLGLDDVVYEYEITNNRVDCYSVIGIAREAAATFKKEFKAPVVTKTGNDEDVNDYIKVEVKDSDLCKRYTARVVKDIKLAPSPEWMRRRLMTAGIRPINNIVDITNYVMEEYGQPMHAYDLETIEDRKIVVARAKDGEKFVTLDGQERNLDSEVLMINDGKKAIGIAGIMGGENSMITDNVKTMLFEAATFDGTNIRKSAKRVGLRTDASGKFEKGLDPENAMAAMDRACQLIEELGAGVVVGGAIDIYPVKNERKRITFEPEKINALLGTNVSTDDMMTYFKRLEIEYDKDSNELIIPTFRQDLLRNADIAEEVARFFGYDNIPTTLPHGATTMGKISFKQEVELEAARIAKFAGFSEAMTYSFESPKVFDKLMLDADDKLRKTIVISNPLGEDFSIMRTLPLNGMLNSLSTNYNRRNKNVKLFELAKVYIPTGEELPDERVQFTLGFFGDGDFFTMKGVVEEFLDEIGISNKLTYNADAKKNFLHPGRQAEISYEGKVLGYLGEVHPKVADTYGIGDRAYVAVLDMPVVTELANFDIKYTGIAKFPAVTRDLSMVMPKTMPVGDVEAIIAKRGGKLVESYNLFDIYEGSQIKEGFKSVAYSIAFRANDRTLEDKDITPVMDNILKDLSAAGVELRA
ncbi:MULTISPECIES: phenylalanine--tRNA ligase subunit beta [Lachnospira]|jgi:phenylalanyl-tRNA synthetase beta chain|uniref:Phenylalanine--tRNA ligase beta subunit n=1 Tax=Lachnospira multipara TaxID=28051 RepID=A0A1H5SB19_9FIRM|nr:MULTISPECIES: phenylalanine--tRNA ligase subunit beta [Lachnospira]MBQ2473201.1 phenylalanine--tRNA ligase subunit beta [Lachnospira sp.]SEF47853.1 phenylalanyl-tRNA synthetase beta subunit [Lachnospira multipara]